MRIAIMGTGALGGFFGARLAHSGYDVTFIARGASLDAMRQNGLQVYSAAGDILIKPVQVTSKPAEVGAVDLVLLCVKAYDLLPAAEEMRPLIGPQTAILPVLNGLDHLGTLSALFGAQHVLGGMAVIAATRTAPGVIRHLGSATHVEFGELTGEMSARCRASEAALKVSGIDASAVPNIVERMWWKLATICGFGVFSVMRGSKEMIWGYPETRQLVAQAVNETVAVANAKGVALPATVAAAHLQYIDSAPAQLKPSMLVDLENGRRLELELLNGAISRMGKAAGVPTPVNDFVYACLKPYVNGDPAR